MEVEEAGPIAPDKNFHARNTRLKGFPSQEAKTRLLERMPEATVGWTFPSAKHRRSWTEKEKLTSLHTRNRKKRETRKRRGRQRSSLLTLSPVGLDQAKKCRADALAVPCWSAGVEKDLRNGCWGEEELLGF